MAVLSSLGGVTFHDKVLPLNEAEPVLFVEKGTVKRLLVGPHVADLGRGGYDSDAFGRCRLLRHSVPHRGRDH